LVKNEAGFSANEAGVNALSLLAQHEMTRHGHSRLAQLGQTIDVASIGTRSCTTTERRSDGDGVGRRRDPSRASAIIERLLALAGRTSFPAPAPSNTGQSPLISASWSTAFRPKDLRFSGEGCNRNHGLRTVQEGSGQRQFTTPCLWR
jgi:hypothetical protein